MSSTEARPSSGGVLAWLAATARPGRPGHPTPGMTWVLRRLVGPLVRLLWRPRLSGWERLPVDRPYLLVANHSGCGQVDVLALALLALERPGGPPRLTGLAHPLAFHLPLVSLVLRGLGAVPSSFPHAQRALQEGVPVLVFPGGDHEAFRPVWRAREVDFAGRQGFLRLARAAGVPIVPLGIWGTCFTQPVLLRSRLLPWLGVLPRLVGIKRLPLTLTWLAGAGGLMGGALAGAWPAAAAAGLLFAWSALPLASFLPLVPWPVRMQIGAPLPPERLWAPGDERAQLDAAYALVLAAVQAAVEAARSGEP